MMSSVGEEGSGNIANQFPCQVGGVIENEKTRYAYEIGSIVKSILLSFRERIIRVCNLARVDGDGRSF